MEPNIERVQKKRGKVGNIQFEGIREFKIFNDTK